MVTIGIIEGKVEKARNEHPDWTLNRTVLEQLKSDAREYYDSLLDDFADVAEDSSSLDFFIQEETGDCSIVLMTPYEIKVDCSSEEFFSVLQHVDSLYLCNKEKIEGEESTFYLSLVFSYKNLFFLK